MQLTNIKIPFIDNDGKMGLFVNNAEFCPDPRIYSQMLILNKEKLPKESVQ